MASEDTGNRNNCERRQSVTASQELTPSLDLFPVTPASSDLQDADFADPAPEFAFRYQPGSSENLLAWTLTADRILDVHVDLGFHAVCPSCGAADHPSSSSPKCSYPRGSSSTSDLAFDVHDSLNVTTPSMISTDKTRPRNRKIATRSQSKVSSTIAESGDNVTGRRAKALEKNREAAARCRSKKKSETKNLVNESQIKITQNALLKAHVQDLRCVAQQMRFALLAHTSNKSCISLENIQQHCGITESQFDLSASSCADTDS